MIIKFTHPKSWNTAVKGLKSNYVQQMPGRKGIWDSHEFFINEEIHECDIWVVHGDLDHKETVYCKKAIFILSEEIDQKLWNQDFINQFDAVLGTQEQVRHFNYYRDQYLCTWQVEKSYDELKADAVPLKGKQLSAVISDSTWKDGHKRRFAFTNKLKGHFKSGLDWYGRGNIFIENKWEGLGPYKYSIAIENSSYLHYWTEKIADCFLAYTVPLYFGCPNIQDYFPANSFIALDLDDFEKSIYIIEQAIKDNFYEKNFAALVEARRLVLDHYQFFPALIKQLSRITLSDSNEKRELLPEHYFTKRKPRDYIIRAFEILTNK